MLYIIINFKNISACFPILTIMGNCLNMKEKPFLNWNKNIFVYNFFLLTIFPSLYVVLWLTCKSSYVIPSLIRLYQAGNHCLLNQRVGNTCIYKIWKDNSKHIERVRLLDSILLFLIECLFLLVCEYNIHCIPSHKYHFTRRVNDEICIPSNR